MGNHNPFDRQIAQAFSGLHDLIGTTVEQASDAVEMLGFGFKAFASPKKGNTPNTMQVPANVYYVDPLSSLELGSIKGGLEVFGDAAGIDFAVETKRVRLPLERDRSVNIFRVGMNNLDRKVPLHFFAMPKVDGNKHADEATLGQSMHGQGIAYIDLSLADSMQSIVTTTAHEVAHSFGFVERNKNAKLGDVKKFAGHCANWACLMYPEASVFTANFCGDCNDEIRSDIGRKLFELTAERLISSKVSKFTP